MYQTTSSITSLNKIVGLELLRFICAFSILIFHYNHFGFGIISGGGFDISRQPYHEYLQYVYRHGDYAVKLFWSISGFIFFYKYQDLIIQKKISFFNFAVLRFSRLYPLHFATLLAVAIFQIIYYQSNDIYFVYQNNNYYYFFLQLFFASNWEYKTVYSFNGPIWSISVEVLVYLVFFITLYQFKAPLKICLLILVITLILLVSKLFLIPKNILDCIWYFFSGGLTVCLLSVSKNRKFVDILSIALIIIIPAAILITQKNPNQNFSYVISAIFNGCFIYILSREISLKNKFTKIVDYFSNMTYSSYLLHFPIQLILVILFQVNKIELPLYSSLFFGFYILVTLLLSALTFRFLEKPLQDYIRFKFLYK